MSSAKMSLGSRLPGHNPERDFMLCQDQRLGGELHSTVDDLRRCVSTYLAVLKVFIMWYLGRVLGSRIVGLRPLYVGI